MSYRVRVLKTKARIAAQLVQKLPPGRPTQFKPEFYAQLVNYALLGATNEEIAKIVGMDIKTLEGWITNDVMFSGALRKGREEADAHIAQSLYWRAKGYEHEDVHFSTYEGVVTQTPFTKYYPPETPAIAMFLRNRRPDLWRRDEGNTNIAAPEENARKIRQHVAEMDSLVGGADGQGA